jgi:hypothetical protein
MGDACILLGSSSQGAAVTRVRQIDQGPLAELESRYRALSAELAEIGFVARGSVIRATTTCSTKSCRCHTDPARRHGPYWQWSRSEGGVTRTRRLSATEAELYLGWIANRRRAEEILRELEALSEQVAEALLHQEAAGEAPRPRRRPAGTG